MTGGGGASSDRMQERMREANPTVKLGRGMEHPRQMDACESDAQESVPRMRY